MYYFLLLSLSLFISCQSSNGPSFSKAKIPTLEDTNQNTSNPSSDTKQGILHIDADFEFTPDQIDFKYSGTGKFVVAQYTIASEQAEENVKDGGFDDDLYIKFMDYNTLQIDKAYPIPNKEMIIGENISAPPTFWFRKGNQLKGELKITKKENTQLTIIISLTESENNKSILDNQSISFITE
ncbi:MAG: hypothetical protein GY810_23245 [Aureispira sp.]|nr:hypothetical protein [Aureispira sp.]